MNIFKKLVKYEIYQKANCFQILSILELEIHKNEVLKSLQFLEESINSNMNIIPFFLKHEIKLLKKTVENNFVERANKILEKNKD